VAKNNIFSSIFYPPKENTIENKIFYFWWQENSTKNKKFLIFVGIS
jgi:hypothetical protein